MSQKSCSPQKLNSDLLGEKGENRFRELCADAALTCNKSSRDRTGWDFIVEFPFEPTADFVTLDQRSVPVSCHVQLKTIWHSSDRVRLRLSSAERLAKETKPTFIYILKVNDSLEPVEAFLVHIMEDSLAEILKNLRAEGAKGEGSRINKRYLTFSTKVGRRIAPTGVALRSALAGICGTDPYRYMEAKRTQLKTLGFEKSPYNFNMTLKIGDQDELVDVFLGLKRNVEVVEHSSSETRFGISLPTGPDPGSVVKLSIDPPAVDRCTISYRRERLAQTIVFDGDLFVAPPFVSEFVTLIKTNFFSLRISRSVVAINLDEGLFKYGQLTVREWQDVLTICGGFAGGKGALTVKPHKAAKGVEIKVQRPCMEEDARFFSYFVEVSIGLGKILELAGVGSHLVITFEKLQLDADKILRLSDMLQGRSSVKFSVQAPAEHQNLLCSMRIAYVNAYDIAGSNVGFALVGDAIVALAEDHADYVSTNLSLFDLRSMDGTEDSLRQYALEMQEATGAVGLIWSQKVSSELLEPNKGPA